MARVGALSEMPVALFGLGSHIGDAVPDTLQGFFMVEKCAAVKPLERLLPAQYSFWLSFGGVVGDHARHAFLVPLSSCVGSERRRVRRDTRGSKWSSPPSKPIVFTG